MFQGEEICVALQTHINDVMLRRYSKARSAAGGSIPGEFSQSKPLSMDVYEKRIKELSKAVEESQRNVDTVSKPGDIITKFVTAIKMLFQQDYEFFFFFGRKEGL